MTPAQRATVSFLDLALIMTGVMAMIVSVGDRHPAVAEALAHSFAPDSAAARNALSVQRVQLPVNRLFEPQEARLTDRGRAAIAALASKAPAAQFGIAVPVLADPNGSRLDRWELAAARTAAIMRILADQGIADQAMVPDLARPAAAASKATVGKGDAAATANRKHLAAVTITMTAQ